MRYEFTCDATIGLDVEANSLEDAQRQWDKFCEGLLLSDYCIADQPVGVPPFTVSLRDEEPAVESGN